MIQTVLVDFLAHPQFVKFAAPGAFVHGPCHRDHRPLFLKFETSQLMDSATGKASYAKLDEFVKESLVKDAVATKNQQHKSVDDALFYSYDDSSKGDRILIGSSQAFQTALEDCEDNGILKTFVEAEKNVASFNNLLYRGQLKKNIEGPSFIKLSSFSQGGGEYTSRPRLIGTGRVLADQVDSPFEKLGFLASETFGISDEQAINLVFTNSAGLEFVLLDDLDVMDAFAASSEDQIVQITAFECEEALSARSEGNSFCPQDAEDQGSEEETEGGQGPTVTSQNQQNSSPKSTDLTPSSVLISVQGGEDHSGVYKFCRDVVCDGGVPSFQKLVNIIAGVHDVHPSKVAVLAHNEGASNAHEVKNDFDLMEQFQACDGEELHLNVAFTKPSFLNVSFFEEEESFRVSGSISFDVLKGVVAAKYGGDPPERMEANGSAITGETDLTRLLHSTTSDELELVAFAPKVEKSLDLNSAEKVGGCELRSDQSVPYLSVRSGGASASWALCGLRRGVYKATMELAHGADVAGKTGALFVGVTEAGVEPDATKLPLMTFKTSGSYDIYLSQDAVSFEISDPESSRFAVAVNSSFCLRSVTLKRVGLLV